MLWANILANIVLVLPLAVVGRPLDNGRHSQDPIVDLGYAQYEGTALEIGVNQFLGIRYAAPPLGDLRFRAPEDPVVTHGVQAAKEVCTFSVLSLF
jgi:acetylcholinesterase